MIVDVVPAAVDFTLTVWGFVPSSRFSAARSE